MFSLEELVSSDGFPRFFYSRGEGVFSSLTCSSEVFVSLGDFSQFVFLESFFFFFRKGVLLCVFVRVFFFFGRFCYSWRVLFVFTSFFTGFCFFLELFFLGKVFSLRLFSFEVCVLWRLSFALEVFFLQGYFPSNLLVYRVFVENRFSIASAPSGYSSMLNH